MIDYPLKFHPILKEKLWGGNKLNSLLNKKSKSTNLGESWEVSGVENNVSIVSNGRYENETINALIKKYKSDFIGNKVYEKFGKKFPLLIKFIDAKLDLSVQLHPNDDLAKKRHDSFGKTEMWYIVQSDENSKLIIGFNELVNEKIYLQALNNSNITSLLNYVNVKERDSFFINPGTVHAIGSGVLVAEIQQTSDVTYRLFDWMRKDLNGQFRELHTDLALKAIKYNTEDHRRLVHSSSIDSENIIENKYFTTNYISVSGKLKRIRKDIDSFKIYICVKGNGSVAINSKKEDIFLGETVLIPSFYKEIMLKGDNFELLEVYIDDKLI